MNRLLQPSRDGAKEGIRSSVRSAPADVPNLFPERLILQARALTQAAFADHYRDTWMLLVDVAEGAGLFQGIVPTDLEPPLQAGTLTTSFAPTEATGTVTSTTVRLKVSQNAVMALPLRKRVAAGRPHASRVCVGRANNSDVVLADASISSFHAYFEAFEEGLMSLTDARSKNGTFVNGSRLTPLSVVPLASGDIIAFARINARVCLPGVFWETVNAKSA